LATESNRPAHKTAANIFEAYPGMYRFTHLPGLAALIRNEHIDAFAQHQYERAVALALPC
jgi:hypothetical protein